MRGHTESVTTDDNTVSTRGQDAPYHHGDLPIVLRDAAIDVIVDNGLGAFSLREVARRAGVSHAAPGYHFGDTRGLLTWVALEGFEVLHRELASAAATTDDPVARLKAVGRAYVGVALQHPAHCEVMFRNDLIDSEDQRVQHEGLSAYAVLESAISDIAARHRPDLDVPAAARLCWSAMQGLVTLHPNFTSLDEALGRDPTDIEAQADQFTDLMVAGIVGPVARSRRRSS